VKGVVATIHFATGGEVGKQRRQQTEKAVATVTPQNFEFWNVTKIH
jgi:hypothetical protein